MKHVTKTPLYLVRGVAVCVLLLMVLLCGLAFSGALTGACADAGACLNYGHTASQQLIDRVLGTPENPDFLTIVFHRWGAAIGGLGGQLLVKVLGFGVLFSVLLTLGLLATRLAQRGQPASRPTQMTFSGDPRQLRGTIQQAHQLPDGTWVADTTTAQTAWLDYQARRAGIQQRASQERRS